MKNTLLRSILSGFLLFLILCGTVAASDLLITVQDIEEAAPIPQASVYIDGTNVGQTTSSGTFLLSRDEDTDFNLKIVKNGYEEWSGTINPDLAFLSVTMTRRTQLLTMQVYDADSLSPIANATIILMFEDDRAIKVSNNEGTVAFPILSDTLYTVTISAPGYRTITTTEMTGKSEGRTVQYWLVRNDRVSFAVTDETGNSVEGATITLNGERVGVTDSRGALILAVPRNVLYAVEVKKEGYQDYLEYRTIGEGEAVISVAMTQSLMSGEALLTISVRDREQKPLSGAGLSLNGRDLGLSDGNGQIVATVQQDTPITITARKDGYSTTSVETIVIPGNSTSSVTASLDRAPDWGFITLIIFGGMMILIIGAWILRRRRPARHIVRRNEI